MILAIDVGNSDIVFGVFVDERFAFSSRIKTDPMRTNTEHAVLLSNIMKLNKIDPAKIKGAVISSVVPTLDYTIDKMCDLYLHIEPMHI